VYPNPTRGDLSIAISGSNEVNYQYTLYNLSGGLLESGSIVGSNEYPISMGQYRSGVYILTLENDTNKETIKVIKE
jgi:hypothetical protein